MRLLLPIALRNLIQARRRNGILGSAIALVTLMLVLLMGMSRGIHDNLVTAATNLSAGPVNVAGFYKITPGSVAPVLTGATRIREIVEANVQGLDYVLERHRGFGKLVSEVGSVQTGLSGILPAEEGRFFATLQLAPESEYRDGGSDEVKGDPRQLEEPDTVVLFVSQAKRLEVGVGDRVTMQTETLSGRSNTRDLRVVAVARDLGLLSSFVIYTNKQVVLDLYQLDADSTGALWVYLKDIEQAPVEMNRLMEVFAREGYTVMPHEGKPFWMKLETVGGEDWTGQRLDLTIWEDEVSFLTWVIVAFDGLTWALTVVMVAIIAVGIMNAMWQSVRERTREVGTMRALGMQRNQVRTLFQLEAGLLGLFSTLVGALLGTAIAVGVDLAHVSITNTAVQAILLADTLHISVSPAAFASAVAALTLFTSAAALWPALRAAGLTPVKALQASE